MTTILQVGEYDLRNHVEKCGVDLTITTLQSEEHLLNGTYPTEDIDAVVFTEYTNQNTNGNRDDKMEEVFTNSTTPMIGFFPPEDAEKVQSWLSNPVEYIPLLEEYQSFRILFRRISLLSGHIPRGYDGIDPIDVANIVSSVGREIDIGFDDVLDICLSISSAYTGLSKGYAGGVVNDNVEVLATVGETSEINQNELTPLSEFGVDGITSVKKPIIGGEGVGESEQNDETHSVDVPDVVGDVDAIEVVDSPEMPDGVDTYLVIPIVSEDIVVGVMSLYSTGDVGVDFTERKFKTVVSMANWCEAFYRERDYQKRLEQKDEMYNVVTSMLTHDLKTPLNVITSRLSILDRKFNIGGDHINELQDAANRIDEMVDSIIQYAEEGMSTEEVNEVHITDITHDCWDLVGSTEAELVISDRFSLEADRTRLRHLFENLFNNSITHSDTTPDDPVTIRIGLCDVMPTTTRRAETTNDTFAFYVEDDGPGIPPEIQDDLFELGKTTRKDGNGFGLAIVKDIAEAHDWSVSVSESRDGGARFEFSNVN